MTTGRYQVKDLAGLNAFVKDHPGIDTLIDFQYGNTSCVFRLATHNDKPILFHYSHDGRPLPEPLSKQIECAFVDIPKVLGRMRLIQSGQFELQIMPFEEFSSANVSELVALQNKAAALMPSKRGLFAAQPAEKESENLQKTTHFVKR